MNTILLSCLSLIVFFLLSCAYVLKYKPSPPALSMNPEDTSSSGQKTLWIYLILVLFSQIGCNLLYLMTQCASGSIAVGYAILFTIVPWVFVFGVLVMVLQQYPSLKYAFSDVIGYFAVSGPANRLLIDLLQEPSLGIQTQTQNQNQASDPNLAKTADAILKIVGNKSILINEITMENFDKQWNMMIPLMKPHMSNHPAKKQELMKLVLFRENLGELCWYVYSGILASSISAYHLMQQGCLAKSSSSSSTSSSSTSSSTSTSASTSTSTSTSASSTTT